MILGQRTTADDNFVLNAACKELIYKDFTSFQAAKFAEQRVDIKDSRNIVSSTLIQYEILYQRWSDHLAVLCKYKTCVYFTHHYP